MPEVITIRWNGLHYKVDKPSWMGGKVVTLDDLEAWLKLNAQKYNAVRNVIFEDLLAQVQAWKEGA